VTTGIGEEFHFIIAAVIGGCLLTGGAGSVIGAAIGALIFGMVQQGMPLVGLPSELFKFFLGVILLGAVLINLWIKKRALKVTP
jgi:simple sugar transport system permease protein